MSKTRFSFNFVSVQIFHDSPLGSGAYGAVYKAKCDKLPCAAKILHASFLHMSDTLVRFRQECDFLESIKHPNIVQFLGLYSDPKSNQTALIMELMDESLTSFLDRHNAMGEVPYHLQVDICHDVVLALHYLHTNEIIHRDLSSNNVLLLGGCIAKVTDLGVSRIKDALQVQQQKMTQCPGSPVYMPPEALRLQPIYSEKLDTFSFGVLIIQIQTRRFPNPEPHEILIADASSPTGFISMPVKESDRRDKDISLIPNNELKTVALHCIEDMAKQRPNSSDLCDKMEGLKVSQDYIDGKDLKSSMQPRTSIDNYSDSKDNEIEHLKSQVRHYQGLMENQTLIESPPPPSHSTTLSVPTVNSYGNVDLERSTEEATLADKEITVESENTDTMKVISNLNKDTVVLLSKSDNGSIASVVYDERKPGTITVLANSRMELNAKVRQVMSGYQKMACTPSQLSFVNVSENCPAGEIHILLKEYNMNYNSCSFSFIKDIDAIQIVSINQGMLIKATEQLRNALRYTMYFSGGRKLVLKKGDITKETVSVLVTATNRHLSPAGGMCKAVNIASRGKVEEYCRKHINTYGLLKECEIVTTPAGGDLKCSWVIHALGPDGMKYDARRCQSKTMNLIKSCLTKGNQLNAASIALPAISTGHYNVNSKVAANGIITAVMDFAFEERDSLRDIRIVIIDDRTFNEFGEVFEERLVDFFGQSEINATLDESPDRYVSSTIGGSCRQQ